jgi:hypothetical protein
MGKNYSPSSGQQIGCASFSNKVSHPIARALGVKHIAFYPISRAQRFEAMEIVECCPPQISQKRGSAAFSGGSRAEARHLLPKRQVESSYFLLSQQSSAIMPKEWYSTDLWTDFGIKFIDDVVARNIRPSSKAKPSCRWKAKSLVPAFANQPIEREAIFWEHEGNAAVRAGDWKLVRLGRKGEWELYNLKTDSTELHNLAAQEPDRNGMRGHCARA